MSATVQRASDLSSIRSTGPEAGIGQYDHSTPQAERDRTTEDAATGLTHDIMETNTLSLATVLPCESRSRRWKSPSTPSTLAPSAERPLSSDKLPVSGTASLASELLLVVLTPLRASSHLSDSSLHDDRKLTNL